MICSIIATIAALVYNLNDSIWKSVKYLEIRSHSNQWQNKTKHLATLLFTSLQDDNHVLIAFNTLPLTLMSFCFFAVHAAITNFKQS